MMCHMLVDHTNVQFVIYFIHVCHLLNLNGIIFYDGMKFEASICESYECASEFNEAVSFENAWQ